MLNRKWDIFEKIIKFVFEVITIGAVLIINDTYFGGRILTYIIIAIPIFLLVSILETFILSFAKNSNTLSKFF